jgi:CelD/BcsL family acetyltransferase involved in cellulose biosynthesis
VLVIFYDDEPVEILPFGLYAKVPRGPYSAWGLKTLRWLGHPEADYCGPITTLLQGALDPNLFELNELRRQIVLAASKKVDLVILEKMRPESNSFLEAKNSPLQTGEVRKARRVLLDVQKPAWDSVQKKLRQDTERTWSQLNTRHEVNFRSTVIECCHEQILGWILANQKKRFDLPLSKDQLERRKLFYLALLNKADKSYRAELATLEADGVLIAAHLGLRTETSFYYLVPAITADARWSRYSPGRQLVKFLIEHSEAKLGLKSFDLGSSHHDWKLFFDPSGADVVELTHARTLLGKAYQLLMRGLLKAED